MTYLGEAWEHAVPFVHLWAYAATLFCQSYPNQEIPTCQISCTILKLNSSTHFTCSTD